MKVIMDEIMKLEVNKILNRFFRKNIKFKSYKKVILQDSTTISLHDNLWRIFRGCGGSESKSSVKCDFIIDLVSNQILHMRCTAGRAGRSH